MALNSNFRTLTADNIEGIVDEKNYLKSSFENGTTVGWTEMNVTLTSGLPTGTPTISASAAGSFELSTTTTQPLSGSRSLLVNVPTGLGVGDGFISQEFTLDRMDYGKVLTVSFDYERVSGTYNFSGVRGSQTWLVYVYDATAGGANWIQPAGFLGMNQSQGPGRVSCTFQSSVVSGQKYRVAVIASQAAAGASSIKFDNFTCSRQPVSVGTPVTDWQSYTPTFQGFGTATNVQFQWRRVGSDLEVRGKFTAGTSTATEGRASFPSGLTSGDTSLIPSLQHVGMAASSATAANSRTVLIEPSVSYFTFGVTTSGPLTKANGSTLFSSGETCAFFGRVPIQGWSSSVQTSDSADTRVVSFNGTQSSQAVTGGTTNISFTAVKDSHGVWSGSTYVVPVAGDYVVAGSITMSAAGTIEVYRNGSLIQNARWTTQRTAGDVSAGAPLVTGCVAGDILSIRCSTSITLTNGNLGIYRLSGPSAIAASETVSASYWTTGTATIVANNPLPFSGKDWDTHNAVTTGAAWKFTAPISGKYMVSGYINPNAPTAGFTSFSIWKNGSFLQGVDGKPATTAIMAFSSTAMLNAGDYIDLRSDAQYQIFGNASRTAAFVSYIQITRIGN